MKNPDISVEVNNSLYYLPELEIKADCINHDIHMTILSNGSIEIQQDGHGGYQCCTSHTSYFNLTFEHFLKIRDFINKHIIDAQDGCEHLNRKMYADDDSSPGFSCNDCGYGT